MKASIKQAQCPKCSKMHWYIHEEASGIGAKTCMQCGFETTAITEFELALGVPVKPDSYARLNAVSDSRNSGLNSTQKSELYKKNKKEMIATYKKEGDVGVLKTYPIHISTWNRLKKEWELIPNEDRRVVANQWRGKPVGSQRYFSNL